MKTFLIIVLVVALLFTVNLIRIFSLRARSVLEVIVPGNVSMAHDFVASLTLRNREGTVITLDHFTIDSSAEANFADGIVVLSSDPPFEQLKTRFNQEQLTVGAQLNPDDVFRATLVLRARKAGEFKGYMFADLLLSGSAALRHTSPVLVRVSVEAK